MKGFIVLLSISVAISSFIELLDENSFCNIQMCVLLKPIKSNQYIYDFPNWNVPDYFVEIMGEYMINRTLQIQGKDGSLKVENKFTDVTKHYVVCNELNCFFPNNRSDSRYEVRCEISIQCVLQSIDRLELSNITVTPLTEMNFPNGATKNSSTDTQILDSQERFGKYNNSKIESLNESKLINIDVNLRNTLVESRNVDSTSLKTSDLAEKFEQNDYSTSVDLKNEESSSTKIHVSLKLLFLNLCLFFFSYIGMKLVG